MPSNTTGYRGVGKRGNSFQARITKDDRDHYLGRFETKELAAHAYDKAAKEYFGEFAWLNFQESAQ
jgi:hypothetical protein